ncbi:NBR1-Ig-like domain-containing protein [Actinokineospora sp. HUAS TT18]|uniref:NBR1-Ig-like domain-containing protein n=1 Tax=Actinokineospora sp. HUAS TT18 TaxID=3447451 RepID=UPI003F5284FB
MAGQAADEDTRRGLIAGFAGELRDLRVSVGTPSFRKMAGVSGVISHTTLHEAAGGSRFPSWETTREFVKVCGADEREWRAKWLAVKGALSPDEQIAPLREEVVRVVERVTAKKAWWTRGRMIIAAGCVVAAVAGFAVYYFQKSPYDPLYSGDFSRFIADVTVPDGTEVEVNETFPKVWEIENGGTELWRGRAMRRESTVGGCQSPERVPVGTTPPGDRVRVTAIIVAASEPGICKVDYKMVDDQDRVVLPGSRPIFVIVNVVRTQPSGVSGP